MQNLCFSFARNINLTERTQSRSLPLREACGTLNHLKNQFGDKINIHMLRPHIIKHGIWDIPRLTFINWAVPIILSTIIFCSLLYIVGLHFFSLLLSILATFLLFVMIGALVEYVNDSNAVFYRNSKEYRSLPKPKKML